MASMTIQTNYKDKSGDRFGFGMSWFWFSCLALLFLLPPDSFAQAHLFKCRPFRANDTVHYGGDDICDLRGDSDADGKPDMIGDFVTVSGTVIAEPSTFETGGRLFWIRDGRCGIMVCGKHEDLCIGDSVETSGWVRVTNGDCFFPESGLATLGDIALECADAQLRGKGGDYEPIQVSPSEFVSSPESYGGNLISLTAPLQVMHVVSAGKDRFVRLLCREVSLPVYLDGDTSCWMEEGKCYTVTGIVTRMKSPEAFGSSPSWCVAPRGGDDVVDANCMASTRRIPWGSVKAGFSR
jgi:hypothetical protein